MKEKICSNCNGTGKIVCPSCGGDGLEEKDVVYNFHDRFSSCQGCNGDGEITCPYCNGTGKVE